MFFWINGFLTCTVNAPSEKTFHGISKLIPIAYYSRSTMSCTQWIRICCAGLVLRSPDTSGSISLGAKMTMFCTSTCSQYKERNWILVIFKTSITLVMRFLCSLSVSWQTSLFIKHPVKTLALKVNVRTPSVCCIRPPARSARRVGRGTFSFR